MKDNVLKQILEEIRQLIQALFDKILRLEEEGLLSDQQAALARKGLNKCLEHINKIDSLSENMSAGEQKALCDIMINLKDNVEEVGVTLDKAASRELTEESFNSRIDVFTEKMEQLAKKAEDIKNNPIAIESARNLDLFKTDTFKSLTFYEDSRGEQYVRFKGKNDYHRINVEENGHVTLEYTDFTSAQKNKLTEITDANVIKDAKNDVLKSAVIKQKTPSTANEMGNLCLLIANMEMNIDYNRDPETKADHIRVSEARFSRPDMRAKYTDVKIDNLDDSIDKKIVSALNQVKFDMRYKLLEAHSEIENSDVMAYGAKLTDVISQPNTVYTSDGIDCMFNRKDGTFRIMKEDGNEMLVLRETENAILEARLYTGVKDIEGSISKKRYIDVAEWTERRPKNGEPQVFFKMKADARDSGFSNLSELIQSDYAKTVIAHRTGIEIGKLLDTYEDMRSQNLRYETVVKEYAQTKGGDFSKLPTIDRIGFAQRRIFEMEGGTGGKYNGFSAGKTKKGQNFSLVSPQGGTLYLNMDKGEISSITYKDSNGNKTDIIDKKGNIINTDIGGKREVVLLEKLTCDILSQAGMEKEMQLLTNIHAMEQSAKMNIKDFSDMMKPNSKQMDRET